MQTLNEVKQAHIISGFLIDVSGLWIFVTAGHIIRDIRTAINAGSTFDIWRLDDQTARQRNEMPAIPYDFDIDNWLVIEDETIGFDYAAIPLDEYYIRHIHAGGGEPITRDTWGDHDLDRDHWALIGIPSESVKYDGKTTLLARFAVIPLEQTDPPTHTEERALFQFYAQITDMGNVTDLDGMSGGPIFSLKKTEDTWIYHVIGVQSGWYKTPKITAACPIRTFCDGLEEIIDGIRCG